MAFALPPAPAMVVIFLSKVYILDIWLSSQELYPNGDYTRTKCSLHIQSYVMLIFEKLLTGSFCPC